MVIEQISFKDAVTPVAMILKDLASSTVPSTINRSVPGATCCEAEVSRRRRQMSQRSWRNSTRPRSSSRLWRRTCVRTCSTGDERWAVQRLKWGRRGRVPLYCSRAPVFVLSFLSSQKAVRREACVAMLIVLLLWFNFIASGNLIHCHDTGIRPKDLRPTRVFSTRIRNINGIALNAEKLLD